MGILIDHKVKEIIKAKGTELAIQYLIYYCGYSLEDAEQKVYELI